MTIGTIVKLKVNCLGNKPGALGVGFNDYDEGVQFIFENGEYDGFASRYEPLLDYTEQHLYLEEVGFDDNVATYKFKNVMQVSTDFKKGVFNSAFFKK